MTKDLGNRYVDEYGNIVYRESGALELLYGGYELSGFNLEPGEALDKYNKYIQLFDQPDYALQSYKAPDVSASEWHRLNQNHWLMPDEYKNMDLYSWFVPKISSKEQALRVADELALYNERGLFDVLKFLIFLVDTMKKHNIVWGVGRGSSVASYCLYLMGVHRVDSMKYNLDIKEFLR